MTTKICTKCGEKKPATAEYFGKRNGCKNGLNAQCKACVKECKKQYYIENADKIKDDSKRYREENADKIKEYMKQYRIENTDKLKEYGKRYREENADVIKERKKQYYETNIEKYKQYRKENADKIKEYDKQYRQKNTDRIRERAKTYYNKNMNKWKEYRKQYCIDNADKFRKYSQIRKARKRALPATLTVEQWEQIKEEFGNRCAYCGSKKNLEQDHFIPLEKDGEYTHNNIIPACKSCNSSKSNKDFFDWYPEQEFYNEQREQKILNHLEYDTGTQTQQLTLINA